MARAGFYAIQAAKIRFGRDGVWYADDERITNQKIADLFSRHLRCRDDGTFAIEMAEETAVVEVEDTPWVVTAVTFNPDRSAMITLNDGTGEPLDPGTLEVGPGQVMYCRAEGRKHRVRFLRAAYYQLAEKITEIAPGRFVLRIQGEEHPIAPL
jgi:hypothetical protein